MAEFYNNLSGLMGNESCAYYIAIFNSFNSVYNFLNEIDVLYDSAF